ncbi:MAG: 16S rRNA (cytidine(1402)-2'-O)-methyltransferase [Acidimicrobiales bacterium]
MTGQWEQPVQVTSTGRFVLVGTPIGNLGDISPRAVQALTDASIVACEDTRRTGRLLSHLGIPSPTYVVVNEHTEAEATVRILDELQRGECVALVSDAGMPGISDPGEFLVTQAIAAGVTIEVVPGPSAVLHALVLSGLASTRFVFEGFLPRKGSSRTSHLREISEERRTVVLFEAPHRLARTLADLAAACGGERKIVLARELTKMHEEIWRGSLDESVLHTATVDPRGEYVLVLEGAPERPDATDSELLEALEQAREGGLSNRDSVEQVAGLFSVSRRRVYGLAIKVSASKGK